ncbi:MAG: hypothetical protein MUP67_04905 [Acidimicrobiia bacterium]|nr:hypothetical protein [Acidimicrobiia bacterium]
MSGAALLASSIHVGGWKVTGEFTTLDLIAATTNALNGALLAQWDQTPPASSLMARTVPLMPTAT